MEDFSDSLNHNHNLHAGCDSEKMEEAKSEARSRRRELGLTAPGGLCHVCPDNCDRSECLECGGTWCIHCETVRMNGYPDVCPACLTRDFRRIKKAKSDLGRRKGEDDAATDPDVDPRLTGQTRAECDRDDGDGQPEADEEAPPPTPTKARHHRRSRKPRSTPARVNRRDLSGTDSATITTEPSKGSEDEVFYTDVFDDARYVLMRAVRLTVLLLCEYNLIWVGLGIFRSAVALLFKMDRGYAGGHEWWWYDFLGKNPEIGLPLSIILFGAMWFMIYAFGIAYRYDTTKPGFNARLCHKCSVVISDVLFCSNCQAFRPARIASFAIKIVSGVVTAIFAVHDMLMLLFSLFLLGGRK